MSELRKAAQAALDSGGIITAQIAQQLRAALAEPLTEKSCQQCYDEGVKHGQERQPLTDEQVFASEDFMSTNGLYWGLPMTTIMQIVRCTERAHGINGGEA